MSFPLMLPDSRRTFVNSRVSMPFKCRLSHCPCKERIGGGYFEAGDAVLVEPLVEGLGRGPVAVLVALAQLGHHQSRGPDPLRLCHQTPIFQPCSQGGIGRGEARPAKSARSPPGTP